MITLRKKAPYTCRFEIAGKPCAAYLKDCDGDLCAAHTQAVERFSAARAGRSGRDSFRPYGKAVRAAA